MYSELLVTLPKSININDKFQYNTRNGVTGLDSVVKVYFEDDLSYNSLPIINGVQVVYNETQKKLSLESLGTIVLSEDSSITLISTSDVIGNIPNISYVEIMAKVPSTEQLAIITDDYKHSIANSYIYGDQSIVVYNNGLSTSFEPEPEPEPEPAPEQSKSNSNSNANYKEN